MRKKSSKIRRSAHFHICPPATTRDAIESHCSAAVALCADCANPVFGLAVVLLIRSFSRRLQTPSQDRIDTYIHTQIQPRTRISVVLSTSNFSQRLPSPFELRLFRVQNCSPFPLSEKKKANGRKAFLRFTDSSESSSCDRPMKPWREEIMRFLIFLFIIQRPLVRRSLRAQKIGVGLWGLSAEAVVG